MFITQDRKKKTRDLELGGGLKSGDVGDDVIWIEELEEQVPAKSGRTRCGRPHEALKLVVKNRKKSNAGPRHIFPPSALSKFVLADSKSWKHPS